MQFSAEYSRITVSVCRTDLLQNILRCGYAGSAQGRSADHLPEPGSKGSRRFGNNRYENGMIKTIPTDKLKKLAKDSRQIY